MRSVSRATCLARICIQAKLIAQVNGRLDSVRNLLLQLPQSPMYGSDSLIVSSLYYLLKYPPSSSAVHLAEDATQPDSTPPPLGEGQGYADAERRTAVEKARIQVAGAFVLCPMVQGMYVRCNDHELSPAMRADGRSVELVETI
jgi:hypothetical protein